MSFGLHNLKPAIGSKRRVRRLGRGHGSGRGKTAGRGTKGQKARTGGRKGLKRLGMRRILLAQPKLRGFHSLVPKPVIVNLGDIDKKFKDGDTITPEALIKARLIRHSIHGVKVLGRGEAAKVLFFKGLAVSEPAKVKIIAAGGRIE